MDVMTSSFLWNKKKEPTTRSPPTTCGRKERGSSSPPPSTQLHRRPPLFTYVSPLPARILRMSPLRSALSTSTSNRSYFSSVFVRPRLYEMSEKKCRSRNFSAEEKELLVAFVAQFRVLESKVNTGIGVHEKEKAWKEVHRRFTAASSGVPRTPWLIWDFHSSEE